MPTIIDLQPSANRLRAVLEQVSDGQLTAPTCCGDSTVGDLLEHISGLTIAFRDAASKTAGPGADQAPPAWSAQRLDLQWRTRLPEQLEDLVRAWRSPAAWEGMTRAGGVSMPAEVMGAVVVDELVLHGWDLARSTCQPYECDEPSAQVVFGFTSEMSQPGQEESREGLFGPVVPVPDDAPMFDRALGQSGRDPAWRPPG